VLCTNPPSEQGKWLSRIHVDFTIGKWFELLGSTIFPTMQVDSNASSAHVFKLAPKLNTLEIEFPSPYGTARPGLTPWVELHDNLEKELGPGHPYTNMGQHPCYNVIVD